MYHGGEGAKGPASFFIVSKKDSYIITKWKERCDKYWETHNDPHTYLWMDSLFMEILNEDPLFKQKWESIDNISCGDFGEILSLGFSHKLDGNDKYLKKSFRDDPPYAIKLNNTMNTICPEPYNHSCDNYNGYFAIQSSLKLNPII